MGEIVASGGWCAPSSTAIEDLQSGDALWKAATRYFTEQEPPQAVRGGIKWANVGAREYTDASRPFFWGIRND